MAAPDTKLPQLTQRAGELKRERFAVIPAIYVVADLTEDTLFAHIANSIVCKTASVATPSLIFVTICTRWISLWLATTEFISKVLQRHCPRRQCRNRRSRWKRFSCVGNGPPLPL